MKHLKKLVHEELIIGLQNLCYEKNQLCDVFRKGKQVKASFKLNFFIYINRNL